MTNDHDNPSNNDPARMVHPFVTSDRDQGGDPVCWLAWTCTDCGAFVGGDPPDNCPRCGASLP